MSAAADLAAVLNARPSGRGWVARCPAHVDRTPSLSIREADDGRLLLHCFAGCAWGVLRDTLAARSLWPGRDPGAHYPPRPSRPSGSAGPKPEQRVLLKRIWCKATPGVGTVVEIYLRSRSLTAPLPPSLRDARLWHRESGQWLPCMIAAVQAADGRLAGLHRTFLQPSGRGKASVEPVKKMLGVCRSGAVRLTPAGRRLALCEGIETGLSIREACPDLAVWCALSAGNLDQLTLPASVKEVVLVADGDPVGLAAARRAAQRYGAGGRLVRLVELPRGMDANDLLRREAAAA
jgi:putative DNA primase/helicase